MLEAVRSCGVGRAPRLLALAGVVGALIVPRLGTALPDLAGSSPAREQFVERSPLLDPAVRRARIAEHGPSPTREARELSREVAAARIAALRDSALLLERAHDNEAAIAAYERAVGLGDVRSWHDLARIQQSLGRVDAAEAAYLAALGSPAPADRPLWQGEIYRDLGAAYLENGRVAEAVLALERAQTQLPSSPWVRALLISALFPSDFIANPATWQRLATTRPEWPPSPPPPDWRNQLETGARSALTLLPDDVRDDAADWFERASTLDRVKVAAVVIGVLLALYALLRFTRQRGDLAITIEYPEELRGTFSVRLSRQLGRLPRDAHLERAEILKGGASSRTEHHLVSRETLFPRLLAGRYQVIVEGILRAPDGEAVLADCFETREVRVLYWRTVREEFDVRPDSCPVDVVVLWDERPAPEVSVAVWGRPQTFSSSRGAPVRLQLERGRHRLAVGSGDRVMAVEADVETYLPTRVVVDIGRSPEVVFKGCPPAVEPYILGDVPSAARALQRDGQTERAQRLLAVWHQSEGREGEAADHFETAGSFLEAAEIRAKMSDYARAAELYAAAKKPLSAAEMYRSAGLLLRAGEAYEAARDFDSAIVCYRESGEVDKWIDALERCGYTFEAAQTAFEYDERSRGIRLLQRVGADEDQYSRACLLLADAYEQEGHWDLAAQKLEEHIASSGPGASAELYARLAGLFEQAGYVERALEMLEDLRRREPTYPNLASRIELLRKQRSSSRSQEVRGSTTGSSTPTVLMTEQRYEILRELGRGGMGVVFQARDRRLGRVVALKQLSERLIEERPEAIQRFLHEAQAAAHLNHPNIVTVYDVDREDGTFFITMEMLVGESLNVVLRRDGRMQERRALQLGLQVASGLDYAHQRGVIHRDIKTANLFLTTDGAVKIMDFGLAKMLEQVRSASTLLGGTPFYMSPEQVLGRGADPRSDLYSFGVTLYELATGRVPFYEGEVAYHHCHTPPVDPRRRVSGVSDEFADLVLKLLEKDPDARPASAAEVGTALEALLQE